MANLLFKLKACYRLLTSDSFIVITFTKNDINKMWSEVDLLESIKVLAKLQERFTKSFNENIKDYEANKAVDDLLK